MSRRHRRLRQRKSFPWLVIALGGILLVLAMFLVAGRGSGNAGGTPGVTVDQQNIDYGYVRFGEDRSFRIKVTNNGDGGLRFKEKPYVEVLEGC